VVIFTKRWSFLVEDLIRWNWADDRLLGYGCGLEMRDDAVDLKLIVLLVML
jgi:hypothetical protein